MLRPRARPSQVLAVSSAIHCEIRREAVDNRDSDDLRKFVGMLRPNRRLDLRVTRRLRLDGHRDLLRSFDFAAPVIE